MKKIKNEDLINNGILFETNRTLLHAVGIDLRITESGELAMYETDDNEGVVYSPDELTKLVSIAKEKQSKFNNRKKARHSNRKNNLGYVIQNVGV